MLLAFCIVASKQPAVARAEWVVRVPIITVFTGAAACARLCPRGFGIVIVLRGPRSSPRGLGSSERGGDRSDGRFSVGADCIAVRKRR